MNPECPLEKFIILLKVKTPANNDAHISRPFWIFELNPIVFDLGHLNAINNLNVQINVGNC